MKNEHKYTYDESSESEPSKGKGYQDGNDYQDYFDYQILNCNSPIYVGDTSCADEVNRPFIAKLSFS